MEDQGKFNVFIPLSMHNQGKFIVFIAFSTEILPEPPPNIRLSPDTHHFSKEERQEESLFIFSIEESSRYETRPESEHIYIKLAYEAGR